ncbi:MAG: hypothetical protein A2Y24_00795 [Clostridiales bacterium GWE2_32_10]|nr:MAG: hypothetical protein A2Y24_00795 [Clostridiales bacterium GWE2_32_10]HBY21276.1 hypothetical protein [Clostridiales bacterium]
MEYIKLWINNLAMFIVLTILVNVIISNKSYKKYINLILGFVLIVIVLTPINKFLTNSDNFLEDEILKQKNVLDKQELDINRNQIESQKKKAILQIYINNMKEQIENILIQNMGLKLLNVDLKLGESDDEVEEIQSIYITVSKNSDYIESDINKIGDEILEKRIKTLLKDFYNIDENNIYVQTGG